MEPTSDVVTEEEVTEEEIVVEDMFFGDKIDEEGALSVAELYAKVEGLDSLEVKFATTIIETCTKKGCWMTVDLADGKEMLVQFKDYDFFVPLEGMEGKPTIFEGYVFPGDTISVDLLQHYAFDAGKDSTEIAAITEPEATFTFLASGVIIKN